MMQVFFSPLALCDLEEIGDFIAEDSPLRALSFVAELEAQCHNIAQAPLAYVARDDLAPGVRMCSYGRYLILYRLDDVKLDIVRIAHGARDLFTLFSPD